VEGDEGFLDGGRGDVATMALFAGSFLDEGLKVGCRESLHGEIRSEQALQMTLMEAHAVDGRLLVGACRQIGKILVENLSERDGFFAARFGGEIAIGQEKRGDVGAIGDLKCAEFDAAQRVLHASQGGFGLLGVFGLQRACFSPRNMNTTR
jgi:hypothetical protein